MWTWHLLKMRFIRYYMHDGDLFVCNWISSAIGNSDSSAVTAMPLQ